MANEIKDKNASYPGASYVTDDADYTLPRKTTPLTQGICPNEQLQPLVTHTVTPGTTPNFACSCGCEWNWESPLHYEIVTRA